MGLLRKIVRSVAHATKHIMKGIAMARRSQPVRIVEVVIPMFDLAFEQGSVDVVNGVNSIEIETATPPKKVWFSFDDATYTNAWMTGEEEETEEEGGRHYDGTPVCAGDIDRVGISLTTCGFIIQSSIASNLRTIKWFAIL